MKHPSSEPPFDPTKLPTSEEIRLKIFAIRSMQKAGKTIDDVRREHFEFARQYPKLVETLMQDEFDTKQLGYLLSMFDKVRNERISFDRASQKVGKTMFDQFLAPNLTPEQMATVQAKMRDLQKASPEELAQHAAALGKTAQMGMDGLKQ